MNIFSLLMLVAMLAVVASLVLGLFAMTRGGENDRKHSNKLMQVRVTLQGVALLLFVLAVMSQGG